jgi:hypothetical protein
VLVQDLGSAQAQVSALERDSAWATAQERGSAPAEDSAQAWDSVSATGRAWDSGRKRPAAVRASSLRVPQG